MGLLKYANNNIRDEKKTRIKCLKREKKKMWNNWRKIISLKWNKMCWSYNNCINCETSKVTRQHLFWLSTLACQPYYFYLHVYSVFEWIILKDRLCFFLLKFKMFIVNISNFSVNLARVLRFIRRKRYSNWNTGKCVCLDGRRAKSIAQNEKRESMRFGYTIQ